MALIDHFRRNAMCYFDSVGRSFESDIKFKTQKSGQAWFGPPGPILTPVLKSLVIMINFKVTNLQQLPTG